MSLEMSNNSIIFPLEAVPEKLSKFKKKEKHEEYYPTYIRCTRRHDHSSQGLVLVHYPPDKHANKLESVMVGTLFCLRMDVKR